MAINFKKNNRVIKLDPETTNKLALLFLIICIISLLFKNYSLAELMATFIFFSLLATIFLQIVGLKKEPKFFKQAAKFELKNKKSHDFIGYRPKKYFDKKIATAINILIVVFYFLIFGSNLPSENNYLGFLSLLLILSAINLILFSSIFKRKPASINQLTEKNKNHYLNFFTEQIMKFFSKKNNVLITIINLSIVIIYLLLFGFKLGHDSNYSKVAVLGTILLAVNLFIAIDLANEKYT